MTISRSAVVPALVALIAASNLGAAYALDVTIGNGETVGGQTLSGIGDTLTIQQNGKIDTPDHGVNVTAKDVSITNYGVISVTDLAYGVYSTAINTRMVNFGGIYTYEDCAYGVYSEGDYFHLTNNGTIDTGNFTYSLGVFITGSSPNYAQHTSIFNNGSILTGGQDAHAISVSGNYTKITNTGLISTKGNGSVGIYTYSGLTESGVVINNSGTIRATGDLYNTNGAHAIQTKAKGAHVTNSGTVISERADAFALEWANSKLTLLQGSIVSGGIRFGDIPTAQLELGAGLDAVIDVTGVLTDANIVANGQDYNLKTVSKDVAGTPTDFTRITTLSTASIEAANTATVQTASTVTSNIANHTGDRRQSLPRSTSALGYAPSPATPDFPDFAPSDDFGAWASAYGELTAPTSGKTGSKSLQGGALVGSDVKLSDDSLAGLFVGLGRGHVETVSKSELDVTSLLGGGYASLAVGSVFIDINATLGVSANDSARRFVNNTVAAGYETAYANYVSMFASPSIKLGMDQDLGFARLTPSVTLTYAGIHQAGYSESGSSANVTMGSSFSQLLNARAELELGTIDLGEAGSGWSGSAKIGADGTLTYGGTTDAQVLGTTLSLAGNSTNAARGFIGANAQYQSGTYSFTAGTELGLNTQGMVSASLRGGVGMRF